jgi:hypothetical protein
VSSYPSMRPPQFYIGVRGSGAPIHYHEDAVNILAHGEEAVVFASRPD